MGKIASKIFKLVTLIFGVAVLICAIYLMATGAGLQEGLDFGAGAYYYADIQAYLCICCGNGLTEENEQFDGKMPRLRRTAHCFF